MRLSMAVRNTVLRRDSGQVRTTSRRYLRNAISPFITCRNARDVPKVDDLVSVPSWRTRRAGRPYARGERRYQGRVRSSMTRRATWDGRQNIHTILLEPHGPRPDERFACAPPTPPGANDATRAAHARWQPRRPSGLDEPFAPVLCSLCRPPRCAAHRRTCRKARAHRDGKWR